MIIASFNLIPLVIFLLEIGSQIAYHEAYAFMHHPNMCDSTATNKNKIVISTLESRGCPRKGSLRWCLDGGNESYKNVPPFLTTVASLSMIATYSVANAADVFQGSVIFKKTCSTCHVDGKNVIAKERSLDNAALEKFIGLDSYRIQRFIVNSDFHRGALAFGNKLSEVDYENVAAYVYDQAINEKW